MKIRKIICADENKILTNGITYGRMIFLADDESEYAYYEIDEVEYNTLFEEEIENQ